MFFLLQLTTLLFSMASPAAIKITEGPRTVTNASVGGSVTFACKAEGTLSAPIWSINRKDYRISDLPLYHEYFLEQSL